MSIKKKKSLFGRQKLLLALLEAFGGRLSSLDLQKYLFLYTEICQKDKSYEFVPYRFGCFSFQSYADRRRLTEVGAILPEDNWCLAEENTNYIDQVSNDDKKKIILFKDKYKNICGENLIKEIYRNYPYYAINSEISQDLMSDKELSVIENSKPVDESHAFFTIGYEGQSFENYLNRLIKNNVKVLCDVRKNPLSRKYGFSKTTLSETLKKLGIEYIHIPELGIVSDKRQELKTQSDYNRLFDDYEKTTLRDNEDALDKLVAIFQKHKRIAITCFEADHCMCHRGRVAKAISNRPEWDYKINHI